MEQSPSGQRIYRHQSVERKFEMAVGDSENIELISAHIEKYIGPVKNVYHELISDLVHIDVHIVAPTPSRNFYTLVTSGMSDRPMNAPKDYPDLCYSELMICLPPNWPLEQINTKNEESFWPIRQLKMLARFPHVYKTWLWAQHTIPNGDPAVPYAKNTRLSGMILLPPITTSPEFHTLVINEEKTIHFHALVPLYGEEMDLKLQKGTDALFDGFDSIKLSELLNPNRPSSIKKNTGFFGFLMRLLSFFRKR